MYECRLLLIFHLVLYINTDNFYGFYIDISSHMAGPSKYSDVLNSLFKIWGCKKSKILFLDVLNLKNRYFFILVAQP